MIAHVEFDYTARGKFKELALDELAFPTVKRILGEKVPAPENRDKEYMWPSDTILTIEEVEQLTALGVPCTLRRVKGMRSSEPGGSLGEVVPQGRLQQVNIQVPHVGLFAVNEVIVEENCCTDLLQRHLDDGWHILCVCPPNAQRRPDYILGRIRP